MRDERVSVCLHFCHFFAKNVGGFQEWKLSSHQIWSEPNGQWPKRHLRCEISFLVSGHSMDGQAQPKNSQLTKTVGWVLGGQTLAKATSVPSPHTSSCPPTQPTMYVVALVVLLSIGHTGGEVCLAPTQPSPSLTPGIGGVSDESGAVVVVTVVLELVLVRRCPRPHQQCQQSSQDQSAHAEPSPAHC